MNEAILKIVLNNLNIDPDKFKASALESLDALKATAARMERIEAMLVAIALKLEIALPIIDVSSQLAEGNKRWHRTINKRN